MSKIFLNAKQSLLKTKMAMIIILTNKCSSVIGYRLSDLRVHHFSIEHLYRQKIIPVNSQIHPKCL